MRKPEYGNTIVNVGASLLSYAGFKTSVPSHAVVDNYLSQGDQTIIVFIFDGLGYHYIMDHAKEHDPLKKYLVTRLTTVFPPTTAAATTAFHTVMYPEDHGWFGWSMYFSNEKQEIELFMNKNKYTDAYDHETDYIHKYLNVVNMYQIMDDIGFLEHTLYPEFIDNKQIGKNNHTYKDMSHLAHLLKDLSRGNEKKIISVYHPFPDGAMHKYGIESKNVQKRVADINHLLSYLKKHLNNTLVLGIADHGLLKTHSVMLNDYPDLLDCLLHEVSNDARFPNFFVKEDKKEDFKRLFEVYFGGDFILYDKKSFLDLGYFGPSKRDTYAKKYLGDFVALATGDIALEQYINSPYETHRFKAEHSGVTEEEMDVPLIAFSCGR